MNLRENAEKNREFFNRKIDEYDDTHAKYMKTKKELADHLPSNVQNILDLGVGTGLELIEVFNKIPSVHVTGIDISEKMIERLMERPFSQNVTPICGNFFEVNFGNNYDALISTSALHHFIYDDKLVLFKKIYDSLKEGAIFINSDKICETDEAEKDALKFYEENKDIKPHIDTPLSINHEEKVLKEAGFKNIQVYNVDKEDYRLFIAYK